MEAIIRTNDRNLFQTVLLYLKSLHITVETNEDVPAYRQEKISSTNRINNKKYPLKGTVLKDEDPFGPATDINDWDVLK